MIIPTLEQAREYAEEYTVIPIAMELYADVNTSTGILNNMKQNNDNCFLLESVTTNDTWGRYSYLGCSPSMLLSGTGGKVYLEYNGEKRRLKEDAPTAIRNILLRNKSPKPAKLPPFTGGLVGYFSYEFAGYFEPALKLNQNNPENFDDFRLMLFDRVIAFDHFRQKIILIVNISSDDLEQSYVEGIQILKDLEQLVMKHTPFPEGGASCGEFSARFTKEEYGKLVEEARHHIREGDIFQVVPSNRLTASFQGDFFQTYRNLRTINPSPYMVYLNIGDEELSCASPETLISLRNGVLNTYPLAGTCRRGLDKEEDERLVNQLLQDEKELAEHDMLVDLGRNDLGKISRFGTVEVAQYRIIKQFSHVTHIASRVTGKLDPAYDAVDAIAATLPAGTLSGAPKVKAMEIIGKLEGERRGPYGGAIGYLDFAGNMDLCIGIRMAFHKAGKVYIQSGGGVVADSDPAKEYEETIRKAMAVVNALSVNARKKNHYMECFTPYKKEENQ